MILYCLIYFNIAKNKKIYVNRSLSFQYIFYLFNIFTFHKSQQYNQKDKVKKKRYKKKLIISEKIFSVIFYI